MTDDERKDKEIHEGLGWCWHCPMIFGFKVKCSKCGSLFGFTKGPNIIEYANIKNPQYHLSDDALRPVLEELRKRHLIHKYIRTLSAPWNTDNGPDAEYALEQVALASPREKRDAVYKTLKEAGVIG